eukprot:Blabericola_migrator_1__6038@NODE_3040_length_2092_cov_86_142716_g1208_i1_p3_GENE_NODE_3040_length_2092_cov_86_142716_g1208_i1NODE_3040_length_2092_cov_86_142716_g1208_i1_p3_ORF_typecomplete_len141_score6_11_NODE_3040_length_2092_cov_86_142716_g1208_i110661488
MNIVASGWRLYCDSAGLQHNTPLPLRLILWKVSTILMVLADLCSNMESRRRATVTLLQEWSASVFDATVRPLYSLSSVDPITNQLYFHPEVNIRFSGLKDEISCARDWLEIYIQAEPKLTQAVTKIKKKFTKEDLRDLLS